MKKISINELKKIELSILDSIDAICRNNNINYSLGYGTLLGAVRHKGFIPWDDDIDIIMKRKDYDNFINFCKENETEFSLHTFKSDGDYYYTFAKATNDKTILYEEISNRSEADLGVYIDIFPIDGLPGNYRNAIKEFKIKEFQRDLIVAYNWKHFRKSKTGSSYREPFRLLFYIISRFISVRNVLSSVELYYSKNEWEKCKYAANAVDGTWGKKNVMFKDVFDTYIELEFEGRNYSCIKEYDTYLKSLYGDYMSLPPLEKRCSHHVFTAYWK